MEEKTSRQEALRRLLNSRVIESQTEVVDFLKDLGVEATQSSVSRDFRELGVIKAGGRYQLSSQFDQEYREVEGDPFLRVRRFVIKAQSVSGNLLVIKTSAAAAHVVASIIDQSQMEGVAGTVAGDDTVFVATTSREVQLGLEKQLLGIEYRE